MDSRLQGEAIMEILKGCDVIIASDKKGIAEKVGQKLGGTLCSMGVKSEEAKILFEIVRSRIFDDSPDTEYCVLTYTEDEDNQEHEFE